MELTVAAICRVINQDKEVVEHFKSKGRGMPIHLLAGYIHSYLYNRVEGKGVAIELFRLMLAGVDWHEVANEYHSNPPRIEVHEGELTWW